VVRADVLLQLAPGTPPGSYRLEVGLAPDGDERPVPLIGPAGAPAGTMVGLGQVQTPGAYRHRPDFDRAAPKGLNLACGCGLRILDLLPGTRTVLPGQALTLRGYYRLVEPKDPTVFRLGVELRRDGSRAATGSWPLVARLPDGLQAGDWLAAAYELPIPVGTPAGEYRLVGRVLGPGGAPEPLYPPAGLASPEVDLGTIRVAAPDREFVRPSPSRPAEANFGSLLQLEGYDLEPAGPGRVRVTLHWRVLGRSEQKLKVSVQLFDGQRLVAQDDGVPVNWTRPASTWVPGEYLTDRHEITLPPGIPPNNLTMLVIVYDEATGLRLPVLGRNSPIYDAARLAVSSPP
jgi:hypothetical protein